MKNSRTSVFGAAVISAIAIGTLSLAAGCSSPEVLKDRPMIPPPSNADPAKQPAVVQPVLTPAPAVVPAVKPVTPAPEVVIPK